MTSNETVALVADALARAQIPCMLAGSYSRNYYGVARATRHADFVILTAPAALVGMATSLTDVMPVDRQMSFEGVTGASRHIARVIDSEFKIEFFCLTDDEHDQARFARRRQVASLGNTIFIPTPEDVIIMKLRWSAIARRPRDLDDATNIIRVMRDQLDRAYLESWCSRHDSLSLLQEIFSSSA